MPNSWLITSMPSFGRMRASGPETFGKNPHAVVTDTDAAGLLVGGQFAVLDQALEFGTAGTQPGNRLAPGNHPVPLVVDRSDRINAAAVGQRDRREVDQCVLRQARRIEQPGAAALDRRRRQAGAEKEKAGMRRHRSRPSLSAQPVIGAGHRLRCSRAGRITPIRRPRTSPQPTGLPAPAASAPKSETTATGRRRPARPGGRAA